MPRTRLVWHLFTAWCSLVVVVLAASSWLASVQMARLADEGLRQRLIDAAEPLVPAADEPPDPEVFLTRARGRGNAAGIAYELVAANGAVLASTAASASSGQPAHADSRFDPATGRRFIAVTVSGTAAPPTASVRAIADTTTSDRALKRAQGALLAGHIACAALALAAGYAVSRRVARPVEELSRAAVRLADGDVDVGIQSTDLAELTDLADAITVLRGQVVERGLLIGRQGTQQEAVLGSMIEGVLAIDARQRIVGVNRAAAELLGVDLDMALTRSLQEVVRNPDLRRFALRAIDCREPVEDDLVLRGPRDRTIRLRGTALRDLSGEGGAVIVLNDVTDMQRLENVRRDFVANVSHELKTPVSSIKGFVETLIDGAADDPEDRRRFLEIISKQADRLAAIIEDLLALSRIEQSEGAGNLPLEPAAIAQLLAAAVSDCSGRAHDKAIRLETSCPEELVAEVNPPLLEQAVINLVDNAIKYSDRGCVTWVSAAIEEEGGGPGAERLVIRIRDEGCGIDAEHLPRLFERFYRVDRARSRRLGGTGLGLSIVKHIVQAHGGTIDVESKPGVGSTFTMRLPLTRLG
jgi:two-component system phosphate regulon sensor histidine kinase PhoR